MYVLCHWLNPQRDAFLLVRKVTENYWLDYRSVSTLTLLYLTSISKHPITLGLITKSILFWWRPAYPSPISCTVNCTCAVGCAIWTVGRLWGSHRQMVTLPLAWPRSLPNCPARIWVWWRFQACAVAVVVRPRFQWHWKRARESAETLGSGEYRYCRNTIRFKYSIEWYS